LKFQTLASFEKHLGEASPDHLSSIYLAIAPCPFERKKIFTQIISAIEKKEAVSPQFFDADSLDESIDALNSLSLFGGSTVVILDGLEKLKKKEWEPLLAYVAKPSSFAYLVIGAASGKRLSDLYTKGKKDIVALDLSEEKPWDRKARLQRHLVLFAQKEGKALTADAAAYLLEQAGLDLPGLEQEMIKLICYVGEKKPITLDDVKTISSAQKELNSWQLAEAIIWKEEPLPVDPSFDANMLFPLFGLLRFQLQQGLQISHGFTDFPQLRGPALEKRIAAVRSRSPHFFSQALHQLFEIELLAKNSSFSPVLLLDLFIAHLSQWKKNEKKTYSASLSQFIG
jgi:DNA polymerase-3 subunit delta